MNDSPPPRRGPRPPAPRASTERFRRPEKPPLRVQTTTLWEYPSQHYGKGTQGDPGYVGATPSYVVWNLVQRYTRPGDLVVVFSSSGHSGNIVAALHEARRTGLESLAFLGRGGGAAQGLATCDVIVPGSSGAAAQEAHLFLIHHFCERIDAAFATA